MNRAPIVPAPIAPGSILPDPVVLDQITLVNGGKTLVRALSGIFAPGSLTAIRGRNGAGKSTLMRALAGQHPLAAGAIRGAEGAVLLPQDGRLNRGFPVTVGEAVALAATRRVGLFRGIGSADHHAAARALESVGLAGFAGRPLTALSAGQFQRLLFARAIVARAPVILLDEPFAAVDEAAEADLLRIVLGWHAEGRTVITVLHDADLVRAAFPRTLLLTGDGVRWGPTAAILPERPPTVTTGLEVAA